MAKKTRRKHSNHKNPKIIHNHKKQKPPRCGPYTMKHGRVSKDTCLTTDLMVRVRDAYNQTHTEPNNRITADKPKEIWRILKTRAQFCNHEGEEECWMSTIKDAALKRDIKKYIYAPHAPSEWKKNPNEWLTNFDILNVMQQYEYTYPHFKFFGPSPIDFDAKPDNEQCVTSEICNLNLAELIKAGKTHLGFVFNLDEHDEPGSHWVSLFVDVPHKFIYYFDSASLEIPGEVDVLANRIVRDGLKLDPPVHFERMQNRVEHQRGNTECGIYSLFFIITMLTGKMRGTNTGNMKGGLHNVSMKERLELFTSGKITDEMMSRYRKVYYNGGTSLH